ncbi:MAG: flavodoxin family protein [Alphaproteobacteria bacterium]|nr:flavodoxin family protein [Alphaproteobacteria bacterium]
MKVLMINGSSNENGCTFMALSEIAETLRLQNIDSEIIQLGKAAYRDCIACMGCRKKGNSRCVFDDDLVNRIIEKAETSDGFVFGSPVYYAHPSGRLLSVLDRAFYAGSQAFRFKPGAAVVSARRAGTTAALDVINKYFGINQMPVVTSSYWNMVHGKTPEEVRQDKEGLQTMRNLAKAMAQLLREKAPAEGAYEYGTMTNFIREI